MRWGAIVASVLLGAALVLLTWSAFASSLALTVQAGALGIIGVGVAVLSLHDR